MKYYLDTNICIYFLKGIYPALRNKLLEKHPDDIKICSLVKAELLYGAEKSVQKGRRFKNRKLDRVSSSDRIMVIHGAP